MTPRRTALHLVACAISGAMMFLASATFDIWPLAWFSLVPLLWAIQESQSSRRIFLYGLLAGTVANAGGFYWIVPFLGRFAFIPLPGAIPIFLVGAAYQGLVYALFALTVHIARRETALPFALLAPAAMVAFEFAVPFLFPWYMAISQAWVLPAIQIAEFTGPLGVTALLACTSGAIADLIAAKRSQKPVPIKPVAIAATVVAASIGFGFFRISQMDRKWKIAPKIRVGIVQPNIRFDLKPQVDQSGNLDVAYYERLQAENNEKHQAASRKLAEEKPDLIVWPESSFPYPMPRIPLPWQPQTPLRQGFDTPLVFGAVTFQDDISQPYNTAMMMDASGTITARYDKIFLLIFGEYIPLVKTLPWIRSILPSTAGMYEHGNTITTFALRDPRGSDVVYRLGPLICYEDILPGFATRVARLHPHLFVNITNDAWFGATSEPYEHLALAVFRSVEHRTGMVRAVQTGVSATIDATGRVRKTIRSIDPPKGALVPADTMIDEVAMIEGGHTIYATVGSLWGRADLLGVLAWLVVAKPLGKSARDSWRRRRANKRAKKAKQSAKKERRS